MIEGAVDRREQLREELARAVWWLMMPHCGDKTPSIEQILGREQTSSTPANSMDLGDGLKVSGDPALIAALLSDGTLTRE